MTNEDIKKIRMLSAKQRCAKRKLCQFSDEEKEELKKYEKLFSTLSDGTGKKIMFYRDFMGMDLETISLITNYGYNSIRTFYYNTSTDFKLLC